MSAPIAVLGGGSWGTALAATLCRGDATVRLWMRDTADAEITRQTRRNPRYLSDVVLGPHVVVTSDLANAVDGAGIVLYAVPTHAMREVAATSSAMLAPAAVLVSAAKGFEESTSQTMTSVLADVIGASDVGRITALSGPNIAVEIGRGLPAASVVAGDSAAAAAVRDACTHDTFRLYSSDDVVGVEYAGALKNVIAIAAGACDGMGAGDNGKAAIMTRGLAEMARLGMAAGANAMTFAGLAGIGDCMVTCSSPHSRNRRLGEAIARGAPLTEALQTIRMVVEGVAATTVALRKARELGVDMPITSEVHAVLFDGKPVAAALNDLMHRDPVDERRGLRSAVDGVDGVRQ